MKIVELIGNKVALVDDADFVSVSKHKWRAQVNHLKGQVVWYAVRTVKGMDGKKRTIYLHREILGLMPHDGVKTDHADGDGLNDQRHNLRRADRSLNAMNTRKRPGASRFKGVSPDSRYGTFVARIVKEQKEIYIGTFPTEEEAASAYNRKAQELFGEFARLNQI